MSWVLLWAGLLLGAFVFFALIARMLYRRGRALVAELAAASDRMARAADQGLEVSWVPKQPELAVFADPVELRLRNRRGRRGRPRHRAPDRALSRPSTSRRLSRT